MKSRARLLAEYLEREFGYTIYHHRARCRVCNYTSTDSEHKFCQRCGTKLTIKDDRLAAEKELEQALKAIEKSK